MEAARAAPGAGGADVLEHDFEVALVERRPALERADAAVAADHRRPVELQVDVGRAESDGVEEQAIEVHSSGCIGTRSGRL